MEDFIKESQKIHNNKYDYSKVQYVNTKTKVCIVCSKHGEFWQLPSNHVRGAGCPRCNDEQRSKRAKAARSLKNQECKKTFILRANQVHNNYYSYEKANYTNYKGKVVITCPIHGDFEQEAGVHLLGCGCPKCKESKGEKLIRKYLEDNRIQYIFQYKVEIDRSINSTGYSKIDFYLPDYNTFIEYNGVQHYVSVKHFGGKLKFEHQQERDEYIRQYCDNNNIHLLELSYSLSSQQCLDKLDEFFAKGKAKIKQRFNFIEVI